MAPAALFANDDHHVDDPVISESERTAKGRGGAEHQYVQSLIPKGVHCTCLVKMEEESEAFHGDPSEASDRPR